MKNIKSKHKRVVKKYKKCVLILIIGSLMLYMTFNIVDSILKVFLQTISSYIIVSSLLDILKKYATDEELIKDISEGLNSEIDAMKLGIKKIDINNEKELSKRQKLSI